MTGRRQPSSVSTEVRAVVAEPFEVFYRREFPRMVSLAAVVSGSWLGAEDIAQDCLLTARRHWSKVGTYDKPGAWLRRITIREAGRRVRRARTETRALLKLAGGTPPPSQTDSTREVLDAIHRLPARQRSVVALHYLEGHSVAEIATILDIGEGTVKTHLFRARATLAESLGDER